MGVGTAAAQLLPSFIGDHLCGATMATAERGRISQVLGEIIMSSPEMNLYFSKLSRTKIQRIFESKKFKKPSKALNALSNPFLKNIIC